MQPDIGQRFLLIAFWAAMLFFAGVALKWLWLSAAASSARARGLFCLFPRFQASAPRQQFFDPEKPDIRWAFRSRPSPMAGCSASARRGNHQVPAAGRPFRLHLLGRRRGIRPRTVRPHRDLVLHTDDQAAAAFGGGARALRAARGRGLGSCLRRAGEGLKRIEVPEAHAGDIVGVTGFEDVFIGETIADTPERDRIALHPD